MCCYSDDAWVAPGASNLHTLIIQSLPESLSGNSLTLFSFPYYIFVRHIMQCYCLKLIPVFVLRTEHRLQNEKLCTIMQFETLKICVKILLIKTS
jgi:hypothetical protein